MKKVTLAALLCIVTPIFAMDRESDSSSSSSDSETERYKLPTKFPSKKTSHFFYLLEAQDPLFTTKQTQIIRYQNYVVFYDADGHRVYISINKKLPKDLPLEITAKIAAAKKSKSFFKVPKLVLLDQIIRAKIEKIN